MKKNTEIKIAGLPKDYWHILVSREPVYIILCFILITILLSSCKDPLVLDSNVKKTYISDSKPQRLEIMPLAPGNYWNYREIAWDSSGIVTESYLKIEIQKDTMINNTRWFTPDTNSNDWLTNKSDGLYIFSFDRPYTTFEYLSIKYPGKVGDVFNAGDYFSFIISTDTTIFTLSGDFLCYHYQDSIISTLGIFLEFDYFYSPGVGLVRTDVYDIFGKSPYPKHDKLIMRRELMSYHTNEKRKSLIY